MRCPGCKREINDGASICRLCGYVVDDALKDAGATGSSSSRTRRSGFTQVHEVPAEQKPKPPTGVRRPADAPGGFVDVAPTQVAAGMSLSTSEGDDDADAIEHSEKTVTSAPPQMSLLAQSAPAPELEDLEDLLEGHTLRAAAPSSPPAVDDDADTVVRAPRDPTSVPRPPRPPRPAPATQVMQAPPRMTLDPDDDDGEDAFAGERTDVIGVRAQPADVPVDDEKTQVTTEPHPPAPRSRR